MASSALLMDLTLSDLEGQNLDWTSFSIQSPQNRVWHWHIFMDDVNIWKRTTLGYHTPWGKLSV